MSYAANSWLIMIQALKFLRWNAWLYFWYSFVFHKKVGTFSMPFRRFFRMETLKARIEMENTWRHENCKCKFKRKKVDIMKSVYLRIISQELAIPIVHTSFWVQSLEREGIRYCWPLFIYSFVFFCFWNLPYVVTNVQEGSFCASSRINGISFTLHHIHLGTSWIWLRTWNTACCMKRRQGLERKIPGRKKKQCFHSFPIN